MSEMTPTNGREKEERSENPLMEYVTGAPEAIVRKFSDPKFHKQVLWTTMSIVLALLVSAVILALAGYDPTVAFISLLIGALRQPDRIFMIATPLMLGGLSVAIAFRCGLFNIGAEGQMYVGALAAAVIGFSFSLPIVIHPLFCLIIAAICGGLYGLLPGLLKAYRGAHEVVTTMMLSYIAIAVTSWTVGDYGPWVDRTSSELVSQSPPLLPSALLPIIGGYYMHLGILIALIGVVASDFLINRTVLGYEMRAVGQNEKAAEYAGINPKKNITIALVISGVLAGLAGASDIMGNTGRFIPSWSPGYGWDGITVAVLGGNNPWGVFAGAIFFAALDVGGDAMNLAGIPPEIINVIQGLIVLFVAAPRVMEWLETRTIDFTSWMRSEENFPIAQFLGFLLSLVGIFISIGLITLLSGGFIVLISLAIVAIASLMAFSSFLSFKENTGQILVVLLIGWLITAVADLALGGVLIGGISAIMTLLVLIELILSRRDERMTQTEEMV
ncbi:MAG: hypothetical protein GF411_00550 [Candidatus Lokiarchaeota archaeon]|nr:hypothetical protein [Candidatus Lokiarchaeota archaeon]